MEPAASGVAEGCTMPAERPSRPAAREGARARPATTETRPRRPGREAEVLHVNGPCEVCGNEYGGAFEIIMAHQRHVFDSFECAIHALAPQCVGDDEEGPDHLR